MAVRGRFIGECPVPVAHGWNVDYSVGPCGDASTASAWNAISGRTYRARCWVLREREFTSVHVKPVSSKVPVGVLGGGGWLVV